MEQLDDLCRFELIPICASLILIVRYLSALYRLVFILKWYNYQSKSLRNRQIGIMTQFSKFTHLYLNKKDSFDSPCYYIQKKTSQLNTVHSENHIIT